MDENFIYQATTFEWDKKKEENNLRKHGISFEIACKAFFDPFLISLHDEVDDEELREKIIGMTQNWRLLYIVYTWRADSLRIISARSATKRERIKYENQ